VRDFVITGDDSLFERVERESSRRAKRSPLRVPRVRAHRSRALIPTSILITAHQARIV